MERLSNILNQKLFSYIRYRRRLVKRTTAFFLFVALFFYRYSSTTPQHTPNNIIYYNQENIELIGVITEPPDLREVGKNLTLTAESARINNFSSTAKTQFKKLSGKVLVRDNLYPGYEYGDRLKIQCKLEAPRNFDDFSYDRFLAKSDIYSICAHPKIKLLAHNQANLIYQAIYKIRSEAFEIVNLNLKEPEAGIVRAVLLGDPRGIAPQEKMSFSQSGISHMMAISGTHISLISAFLMFVLIYLGLRRQPAFIVSIIFLIIYIILIGAPASAIRSGIMGFLVMLALNIGRINKIINALIISAVILLLINPRFLRDDIGFQLSFLAVLGMVWYYPILNELSAHFLNKIKLIQGLSKKQLKLLKPIGQVFLISISAQILVTPIIIFNFKIFSLVAPIANVLVLWTFPFLMFFATLGLIIYPIIPVVGNGLFLIAGLFVKYIVFASDALIKIPYAYLTFDYISLPLIGFYYLVCLGIFWLINKELIEKRR
ncbi:MAG: ComEC/Rec2 family competence protein [Candidatus Falkowbacteria bacterium]|nr:ComEC/Rec2 family competence protein [Candidatus Falkowbacteria bacterium]